MSNDRHRAPAVTPGLFGFLLLAAALVGQSAFPRNIAEQRSKVSRGSVSDYIAKEYARISKEPLADYAPAKPSVPVGKVVSVGSGSELQSVLADSTGKYPNLTVVLKNDIKGFNPARDKRGKMSLFIVPSGKTVRILGNGHGIFEYGGDGQPRESTAAAAKVYGEAFTTSDGTIHPLAKSDIYFIKGWRVDTVRKAGSRDVEYYEACGIEVPRELKTRLDKGKIDLTAAYISMQVSWTRTVHKVAKYSNGVIYFSRASLNGMNAKNQNYDRYLRALPDAKYKDWELTEQPTFFLVNTDMDHEGVVVRSSGKVSCPASYSKLWRCKAERLFFVENGATLYIQNAKIRGGKEMCIQSYGTLWLDSCVLTNPLGYGLYTHGTARVEKCEFRDIRASGIWQLAEDDDERWKAAAPGDDWPRMSVTDSKFVSIGHYGANDFAVRNESVAYIARNEIIDANYGAIWTGNLNNNIRGKTTAFLPAFKGLVERNHIRFTDEWVEQRKTLGLRDAGYIYIAPNNGKAVVRLNRLERCGGRGMNNAIYADDGPYNTKIYCNMVSGTENRFDIDFRDLSSRPEHQHAKVNGTFVNTANTICLNYCEGFVRIEDNSRDDISGRSGLRCVFKDNVVLGIETPGGRNKAGTGGNTINYKHGDKAGVVRNDSTFAKALRTFIIGKMDGR